MADIFELFKQISKDNQGAAGAPTHMIVGLGNPGKDYAETRHNAGFLAMDKICAALGCECQRVKFKSFTNTVKIGDKNVLLMMPQTYMNLSGEAVGEAAKYYNIPAENIIVMVDDIYLEPGFMRIRKKGSAGGHNGLKNIIEHLGSDNFPRIKLGVGAKPKEADLAAKPPPKLSAPFTIAAFAALWVFLRMADTAIRNLTLIFWSLINMTPSLISTSL